MSNTVITNFTDLSGPISTSDTSAVVFVNKDGSILVDKDVLNSITNDDGLGAGISVVRIGNEGIPEDATDTESDEESIPHVTVSVDGYIDQPNTILKYESAAEMLQSLSLETRENSLVGFQNDHCYTSLTSPSQTLPSHEPLFEYDEDIEPEHSQRPPIPKSKKITILEQQIIPKGKKLILNPTKVPSPVLLKGPDAFGKAIPLVGKEKKPTKPSTSAQKSFDQKEEEDDDYSDESESESDISPGDHESDSDYQQDLPTTLKGRKVQLKQKKKIPVKKVLKEPKQLLKQPQKSLLRQDVKTIKVISKSKISNTDTDNEIQDAMEQKQEQVKVQKKEIPKKEKKTPAHVNALLTDMTSLFSTPDVIRRVSTDKNIAEKAVPGALRDSTKTAESKLMGQKSAVKTPGRILDLDSIPQIDDASLAQLLQDKSSDSVNTSQASAISAIKESLQNTSSIVSPNLGTGLAAPLSPTLDLLAGLQTEDEGLSEDLLMHVAQLVESSEHLQEVIDKQVLGKVDTTPKSNAYQQGQQGLVQSDLKLQKPRKEPVQVVRSDGRVITLPPIEAPATRASKRKSQGDSQPIQPLIAQHIPEPTLVPVQKQQVSVKKTLKKQDSVPLTTESITQALAEEDDINSEDDPYRLWCICKQPHNNRFMICCDRCEDWFHGKCVNITKAMGQQMEEEGIEWTCPNCIKKTQPQKSPAKVSSSRKSSSNKEDQKDRRQSLHEPKGIGTAGTNCIVCKNPARASSIYCSDACILKHAQDSLTSHSPLKYDGEPKVAAKPKPEARVIVFERKTGRCLAGPKAPTAENLKLWLQKNPTFEVVRPGELKAFKPGPTSPKKPVLVAKPPIKTIQTKLSFDRTTKQAILVKPPAKAPLDETPKSVQKQLLSPTEERRALQKQISTPKQVQRPPPLVRQGSPKTPSTPVPKTPVEQKKLLVRPSTSKAQTLIEKTPPIKSPPATTSRKPKMEPEKARPSPKDNTEPIRENVRKALQEQMSIRMDENKDNKFTEDEVKQFAIETEAELHELFRDVGTKYKAKYRSLMFNIKDRKNLSLWQKICDKSLTPYQLVRLSPEELASQELAQWRAKEEKHQLELIKKSELDLLAASKTYVLKTHKGEEVMETKKSVSTELDPNVAVEDLVHALNDSTAVDEKAPSPAKDEKDKDSKSERERRSSKRDRSTRSKKSTKDKSIDRATRSRRRSRSRDRSREKSPKAIKRDTRKSIKEKGDMLERSRHRSRSKNRSKSKGRSRSRSKHRTGSNMSSSKHRSRSKNRSASKERSRSRSKHNTRSKNRNASADRSKYRSLSQDNTKDKDKDADLIERPKSALQKETHPEYDPHEPMITSAISEEDLRKPEENFDDSYEKSMIEALKEYKSPEYTTPKAYSTPSGSRMTTRSASKSDRIPSEAESDQEPSSTVDSSILAVWNGCVNMVDVARFYVAAFVVSGQGNDLEEDLPPELDIVGRINPETVWDYISKMRRAGNKDIVVLRLAAANDEEKMQYIALYSYLNTRNRLGVVKVANTTTVKDFYVLPLPANSPVPPVLQPLQGPGLEEPRSHLLVAIIVRQKKKRIGSAISKDVVPAKVARGSRTRSYTPPVTTPASLPLPYASPALSTSVKNKIAATLASAEDEEPYSPGSSSSNGSSGGGASALRNKMEELNRQIEEQKQQIMKIASGDAAASDENEAYSPSRPMTPPRPSVPLSDISLPSNLQEILASIQQRSADVDMRRPTMPIELQQPPPASGPGSLHTLTEEELLRMVPDDQ